MKIKYSVLVGILAAGILAAPAMAGSTGAKGGTKATVVDNSKDASKTTIQGTFKGEGCYAGTHEWDWRHNRIVDLGKQVTWSSSDVQPVTISSSYTNPAGADMKKAMSQVAANIYDVWDKFEDRGNRGSFYGFNTSGSVTQSNKKQKSTYEAQPDDLDNLSKPAMYDDAHKQGTSYDNRVFQLKDAGEGGTAMLIGDDDYMDGAYAASGKAGRYLEISGEYGTDWVMRVEGYGIVSPIILDLDGDGKIEASNGKYMPHSADVLKSKHAVMFDFYGNGFPVAMEWVGANDGLLCRPHKDGSIDGTCLFGVSNGHDNGYEEMSALDIDRNGSLEGAELEGLMVWTDKNCNGAADQGEVASLESLGITSIGVTHNNFVGNYVRNGKSFKTFDWWPCVIDCRRVNLKKI